MLGPRFRQLVFVAASAVMLSAACAPASQGSRPEGAQQAPATPKLLRVGIASDAEPKELGLAFGNISAGGSEPRFMLHASLTVYDEQNSLQPRLVERIPAVENGD